MLKSSIAVATGVILTSLIVLAVVFSNSKDNTVKKKITPLTTVYSKPVAFITVASADDIDNVRALVGSVHRWHPGFPVVIYAIDFAKEDLLEARNWDHTEVVQTKDILPAELSKEDWIAMAMHDAGEQFDLFVYVESSHYLSKPLGAAYEQLVADGYLTGTTETTSEDATSCCDLSIMGFVPGSQIYAGVVNPVTSCVIRDKCRGKVTERMLQQLTRVVHEGVGDAGSEDVSTTTVDEVVEGECVCKKPVRSDGTAHWPFSVMDLSNEKDAAWHMVDYLSERDADLIHFVDGHEVPAPAKQPGKPRAPKGKSDSGDSVGPAATGDESGTVADETGADGDVPAEGEDGSAHHHNHHSDAGKTRICMIVPSTTRGKKDEVVDSTPDTLPFFHILIKSMIETVREEFSQDKFSYEVFLGVDVGDPIYDNHEQWERVQQIFRELTADYHFHLKVKKFGSENRGAPAWIWNGLFQQAYDDGCEYFYQINDDVQLITPGWSTRYTETLKSNPRRSNLGMVGPADVGNQKTMTQALTHRTHMEIFGTFYPPSLKNWYSDDWATHIYDDVGSTFWLKDTQIRNHNPRGTRYHECGSCDGIYQVALNEGKQKLNQWLAAHP